MPAPFVQNSPASFFRRFIFVRALIGRPMVAMDGCYSFSSQDMDGSTANGLRTAAISLKLEASCGRKGPTKRPFLPFFAGKMGKAADRLSLGIWLNHQQAWRLQGSL